MLRDVITTQQQLESPFTPSWLSAIAAIIGGLLVSVGVIVAFSFHSGSIQQQLLAWEITNPKYEKPLTTPEQNDTLEEIGRPTLQDSWTLIIVWSLVGLLTYGIAASIIKSVNDFLELKKTFDYANTDPQLILRNMIRRILWRILASIVLAISLLLFIQRVIPYGITVSRASASDLLSFTGIIYALLSFAMIAACLHGMTILLRYAVGKVRLFDRNLA